MNKLIKTFMSIVIALVALTSCSSNKDADRPFTVAIVADFQSISPGVDVGALSKSVLQNMNGYLYRYNADTKIHEPSLATNITYDKGIISIQLRDNIFFHNDAPVTANDVAYSIKRVAGLVPEFLGTDSMLVDLVKEDSFTIVDDTHLTIAVDEKLITTNTLFSIYNTAIVPANYSEKDQETTPVSSGPYKFVAYEPGNKISFTKFDKYYDNSAEITNVDFTIISDTSSSLFAFQMGEIDYLSLTSEDLDSFTQEEIDSMVTTELANDTNTLFMNSKVAPYNDVDILKAIKYGINKSELIKLATNGIGEAQASVLSPYQERYYNSNLSVNEFDPELSKRILEAKGYTDANRLTINLKVVAENKVTIDMANIIKSQLADVYVDVIVYEVPWSTYFDEVYINKNYDATILQLAGYDNPYKTLRFFKTGEVGNLSGYSNKEYDDILKEILVTLDEDKKVELFKKAQQIIFFDTPAIFLGDEGKIVGLNKNYSNVTFYPYWYIDISSIKVEK